MALKLFKKNLFGVAHALRFGRYGSIIKSINGELAENDPIKLAEIKSNDLEVLDPDETTLRNLRLAASEGYTSLSAGPEKERNKKRATNREEIETDFVRKTSRIVRELSFLVNYNTANGTILPNNLTDADIVQPYPIPSTYILESLAIKCGTTYNGTAPTVELSFTDDTPTSLITLTADDLTAGEKVQIELSYLVTTSLTFSITQSIGGSTAGSFYVYLTYYGME